MFEQQRLRTPVFCARWLLLETTGRYPQITNDMGYTPFWNIRNGDCGIAIPVGKRHILNVMPQMQRVIAIGENGRWWPTIERGVIDDEDHLRFLQAMVGYGQRFVVGPDARALNCYLTEERIPPRPLEPRDFGFLSGRAAASVEMAFLHIFPNLSAPPPADRAIMKLDMRTRTLTVAATTSEHIISVL
jgi:hypothetical protein